MQFCKISTFLFFLLFQMKAYAELYQATRSFENIDELEYSEWVKNNVTSDIFSNPNSPYYGIKTDCADAAIALRVIYSYEQKLSFEYRENNGRILTEKTSLFDHVSSNQIEKLKAFIAYIGENTGSEILAHYNTYPIELKSIRPGDLYITRWKNSNGEFTRHVYIIKEVLATGDFTLISSTTPRAIRPLLARKGMPLKIFTESPFGFKRFLNDVRANPRIMPDYSLFQYEAIKSGEESFFKLVKNTLKVTEDTLELNIQRLTENVCVALKARVNVVQIASEEKKKLRNTCFKKSQYDEYSSPSRDRNIIQDIERLRNGYRTIVKRDLALELEESTKKGLDYLIGEDKTDSALSAMRDLCNVKVPFPHGQFATIHIKLFYDRYNIALISSNPNHSLESRWGFKGPDNSCPDL